MHVHTVGGSPVLFQAKGVAVSLQHLMEYTISLDGFFLNRHAPPLITSRVKMWRLRKISTRFGHEVGTPGQAGHPFRANAATDSALTRSPQPIALLDHVSTQGPCSEPASRWRGALLLRCPGAAAGRCAPGGAHADALS